MAAVYVPLTIVKSLAPPRHICCFFDSRDQQHEALVPYFAEGIANGEQVVTITDTEFIPEHLSRLAAGGIKTEASSKSGPLCALCTDETYLAGGTFGKKQMYDVLEQKLKEIASSSSTGIRTCGDMSWH